MYLCGVIDMKPMWYSVGMWYMLDVSVVKWVYAVHIGHCVKHLTWFLLNQNFMFKYVESFYRLIEGAILHITYNMGEH